MTAPLVICQEPGPGETRDCLDPWKMSFVHADGGVSLCCWSRSIGSIQGETVNQILEGEPARAMRRGLLTGRVPVDCVRCPSRNVVPVGELRQRVEQYLAGDDRRERMELRARAYGLQDQIAAMRRRVGEIEHERDQVARHNANLEEERDHLSRHNALLAERLNAIHEGRANILRIVGSWTRGALRRTFKGGGTPAKPAD